MAPERPVKQKAVTSEAVEFDALEAEIMAELEGNPEKRDSPQRDLPKSTEMPAKLKREQAQLHAAEIPNLRH